MYQRFLPGVPGEAIEQIFSRAPGNEMTSGKFDSPESSAALAANTFGFFLHSPRTCRVFQGIAVRIGPHFRWPWRKPFDFPGPGGVILYWTYWSPPHRS